ncbi:murein L,D-transpeptidase family protein [Rhizobium sp. CC-YZS058]|uniref:murein L,D-transpeptidase family protein n=1 Tax=Rhizobium sp. CC-YZS058 TaxID=3042153 RepID=UPI002B062771|nr:murein L,D-transpeptidase family protein [Rhizobium sp. CC-YZS058]MEA3534909.1 murein L,D-transpeptidase family protein [Rhizobium sp. CC-YZS058]
MPSSLSPASRPGRGIRAMVSRLSAVLLVGAALSACTTLDDLADAPPTLTNKMVAQMRAKGMKPESPVLVRIFKQESELEIWKVDRGGSYALLKTYPICRWSGQLGPKRKSGDRHAPEGFYQVGKGALNPKSQYYVSFNLGYPNRLERALGYTGEALMVHGACSSSGCYAMTDQGIGEIYAIVAKALESGQPSFQVQAYPFRMTAANMAAHRGEEDMGFWTDLKTGYDAFQMTKREPKVSACGGRYVFNRDFGGAEPADPLAACPPSTSTLDGALTAKLEAEQAKTAALSSGEITGSLPTTSAASAYLDGGMHPSFRALLRQKGPQKLAASISGTKYPISRPEAALADPFAGQ